MFTHTRYVSLRSLIAAIGLLTITVPAAAQGQSDQGATAPPQAAQPATQPPSESDARLDPLQPDFTLVALPVTLRLPAHKMAFRLTHRFTRSLGRGDAGDLASDLFGLDSEAQVGLELRYGLRPGTQIGLHRTNDHTIELFGQQSVWREAGAHPVSLDAVLTFEGTNNLRSQKSGAFGAIVGRKVGRKAALYAEPIFIANTNAAASGNGEDNNTFMLGLGARVRVRKTTYLVGEVTPRLAGYDPGVNQISFGVEMRAGGHTFQLNFSNGVGTTLGQIARGGVSNDSWYIGFNLSRKFF